MHLISWGLTCSCASVLMEDDLVLAGKCVKGISTLLQSSSLPGKWCGSEQEAECTRRPKEMRSDGVRTAAVPQDSAAQKRPPQGAKHLFWAGFQPWYWLVMINLLELGRTLAQVDRTQSHSVLRVCWWFSCSSQMHCPSVVALEDETSSVFKQKLWVSKELVCNGREPVALGWEGIGEGKKHKPDFKFHVYFYDSMCFL